MIPWIRRNNTRQCPPFFSLLSLTSPSSTDTQLLVGFACGHVFHLSCLLKYEKHDDEVEIPDVLAQMAAGESPAVDGWDRSVGPKVDRAALLRTLIGDGCPVTAHKNGE